MVGYILTFDHSIELVSNGFLAELMELLSARAFSFAAVKRVNGLYAMPSETNIVRDSTCIPLRVRMAAAFKISANEFV